MGLFNSKKKEQANTAPAAASGGSGGGSGVLQMAKETLENYKKALAYLDTCGPLDEAKFREMNRLAGSKFTEPDIQGFLGQAKLVIGGLETMRPSLRDTFQEGIRAFGEVVRQLQAQ